MDGYLALRWSARHWLSSFEWKDQSYCAAQCSMRWKWLPANYSSWIFDQRLRSFEPITGLYRSILFQWMATGPGNLSRNPTSKSVGKSVKKSDIGASVKWNLRDTVKRGRHWLTKERQSFVDWCNRLTAYIKSANFVKSRAGIASMMSGNASFALILLHYNFILHTLC